jgi:hypothetical protein
MAKQAESLPTYFLGHGDYIAYVIDKVVGHALRSIFRETVSGQVQSEQANPAQTRS